MPPTTGALPNETQEAVQLRREEIGTPDELVLVIHGIGQGLAGTYDSFSFVYACNAFRSACTTLSTSPTLSPLLNGKRAQFIPVLWRAELDFDEVDESADAADEHLANRFSLADIEVPNSIPFLRQVVSGLVLDVPFYLSPSHKTKMLKSVVVSPFAQLFELQRLTCALPASASATGSIRSSPAVTPTLRPREAKSPSSPTRSVPSWPPTSSRANPPSSSNQNSRLGRPVLAQHQNARILRCKKA